MIRIVNGTPVEMTAEEQAEHEAMGPSPRDMIELLKARLAESDYKTLKYVEGALTEEEFIESCAIRAELRREINEIEENN